MCTIQTQRFIRALKWEYIKETENLFKSINYLNLNCKRNSSIKILQRKRAMKFHLRSVKWFGYTFLCVCVCFWSMNSLYFREQERKKNISRKQLTEKKKKKNTTITNYILTVLYGIWWRFAECGALHFSSENLSPSGLASYTHTHTNTTRSTDIS